ncbi:MAG: cyclic nucleotide-binding domain-containing protein, partial [Desulfobacterales bacterium]|nr:cyclic nucleotide-binding domain-containing protein [Desulfobacterales bacterium]
MVDTEILKQINFLADLADEILEKIAELAQLETFDEETVLLRQDQEQHLVYMLVSGKIFLNSRSDTGKVLTLDEICPGQTFGLSALLGDATGAFTAICAEECRVIT